jgi:hypothetical protein
MSTKPQNIYREIAALAILITAATVSLALVTGAIGMLFR